MLSLTSCRLRLFKITNVISLSRFMTDFPISLVFHWPHQTHTEMISERCCKFVCGSTITEKPVYCMVSLRGLGSLVLTRAPVWCEQARGTRRWSTTGTSRWCGAWAGTRTVRRSASCTRTERSSWARWTVSWGRLLTSDKPAAHSFSCAVFFCSCFFLDLWFCDKSLGLNNFLLTLTNESVTHPLSPLGGRCGSFGVAP